MTSFVNEQRRDQTAFFAAFPQELLMDGWAYRLVGAEKANNLNPAYRQGILAHFAQDHSPIEWHGHSNHALSSQVCCINFLAPLMRRPGVLASVIGSALGIAPPEMLPVGEGVDGQIYVDFEWVGQEDYLSEWPKRGSAKRGANATAADAVARMRDPDGSVTTILIEWKYTETYGAPLDPKGNPTRLRRYQDKAFAPDGPLRTDLGLSVADFFWEPFYQLLRQQMLAWRMERAREAGASRVVVLHLSARGNRPLHKVTAPALRRFGDDAFKVFESLLADPSRFHAASIEQAFQSAIADVLAKDPIDPWAIYLQDRYSFANDEARFGNKSEGTA